MHFGEPTYKINKNGTESEMENPANSFRQKNRELKLI